MENHGVSEEFGKDLGLVHEAVITGRKVGAGKEFWAKLAHDEEAFRKAVAAVLSPMPVSEPQKSEEPLAEWQRFYHEVFALDLDVVGIKPPLACDGFNWLVVVPEGMTPNRAYAECEKRFTCWRYTGDLDEAVRGRNDREATTTYAIRMRDRIEADKELASKSANDLARDGVKGVTLLERLILELWYFWKTGKHLDLQNVTLCSGSRPADGRVPRVSWHGAYLEVGWCSPTSRDAPLRSREAVS